MTAELASIEKRFREWSSQGFRVLGVASKVVDVRNGSYTRDDEMELKFEGFLLFFDPPKSDASKAIADLAQRGVQLKMVTGDNQLVARHVAEAVNLPIEGILTGADLNAMSDDALWYAVQHTSIFAEVDPNQKERIILALQKTGAVQLVNPAIHSRAGNQGKREWKYCTSR